MHERATVALTTIAINSEFSTNMVFSLKQTQAKLSKCGIYFRFATPLLSMQIHFSSLVQNSTTAMRKLQLTTVEKLSTLQQPMARINVRYSSEITKKKQSTWHIRFGTSHFPFKRGTSHANNKLLNKCQALQWWYSFCCQPF